MRQQCLHHSQTFLAKQPSTLGAMVSTIVAIAAVASLATVSVEAQDTMLKPAVKFTGQGNGGARSAEVLKTALPPLAGDSYSYGTNYDQAAAAFVHASRHQRTRR
ncbi:unnamed protein product [Phytophthora lilii]|uniref:Unnamed protein product n=1 Tax=Phytophthora lilii TaxID=2077276 RepID=A0A9W6TIQ7_9STRA|nr:unnamed protein product [Phytophthora lilii]